MKMRKLLASSVAATVAVTSLATVASAAEPKTFDMGIPSAIDGAKRTGTYGSIIGEAIGKSATQDSMQIVEFNFTTWLGDDQIWANMGSEATLTVKGYKLTEIGGESQVSAVSKDYKLLFGNEDRVKQYGSYIKDKWFIVVLKDSEYSYKDGEFAPSFFTTIEEMYVTYNAEWAVGTSNKTTYVNKKGSTLRIPVGDIVVSDWTATNGVGKASNPVTYSNKHANNLKNVNEALDAGNGAAALIGYALTHGGYKPSFDVYEEGFDFGTINWSVKYDYPYLVKTDDNDDNVLKRHEIDVLSYSDSYYASNAGGFYYDENGNLVNTDTNQSYDSEHEGDTPYQFAGLATQVAEYFNKQTNGTITFTFTTKDASGSTTNDWIVGGVPSTQVGIRNDISSSWTNSDFALYVNYAQTGSLEALASIDAASGSVTFDISDILDSLGGQTLGVVDNLYYGLTANAVKDLKDNKLYVEKITLAYEEDAAEDIEEPETEEPETEEPETEEPETEEPGEDEGEAEIDGEEETGDVETEEDDDANGDVVTGNDDDDSNPATGVALAVVPALVAAAAAVVSKKRK